MPASETPPGTLAREDYELTRSAILVGVILGIIFGASSLYLVLRVGMTVSASIPVAVLSITLFRALSEKFGFRRATILENNIVQTTGSAGESIAFGVGVTMPAVMILGYDLEITRVMLVACLGGLLGILMMIPLRRAFIVEQHDTLKYPEGTACAKVLEVGEAGGSSARTVFTGFGIAFFYQIAMQAMHLWKEVPSRAIGWLKGGVVACEVSPALLGVGYIIGPRVAAVMIGGGILAALVLTPMIAFFGSNAPGAIFPGDKPIPAMSPKEIRDAYILYIGAGAVAAGGIISMIQALPMIFASIRSGLKDIRGGGKSVDSANPRDRDLPLTFVIGGSLLLVAIISGSHLIPTELPGRIAGAIMILLFGFLFVTVSSRLTGEIGSSSNPISGMTVATLLLTCLVFVLAGWVGPEYRLAALSIAGIVCVAASNGGTTSQDLKTGYLVGATPAYQQIAILAGALSSAIVIGFTLLLLNKASTVVTAKPEFLPKINAPNVAALTETEQGPDGQNYKVWRVLKPKPDVAAGKYLVDDTGKPKYLVDPAINGRVNKRDDGSDVVKFDAPKASLTALIIDGVLQGDLPWGLVAIGVLISVVLQLCGVPALAFAVGVYLPLSASAPIFVGGLVRLVCDRRGPKYAEGQEDSSPAVLFSSGLIAGGAIAGILVALLAILPGVGEVLKLGKYLPESLHDSDLLAILTFAAISLLLVMVGMGQWLGGKVTENPPGA
ncbi:MAG: OPT family oligopeptide transporter [bacterium]